MVCPACRSEYRVGFDQCADCSVPLLEELPAPPPPPPPPEPEAQPRRWELNRRDSLNIAFVKGALIGFACGEALNILGSALALRWSFPIFVSGNPPVWFEPVRVAVAMLAPLGIVLGGYLGIRWSR